MQLPTTAQARRAFWQEKLGLARAAYADELARMEQREALYEGTRQVQADPNTRQTPGKLSSNVRNIVYELIESQVDATIPMPRVEAIHPEDEELARRLEDFLRSEEIGRASCRERV